MWFDEPPLSLCLTLATIFVSSEREPFSQALPSELSSRPMRTIELEEAEESTSTVSLWARSFSLCLFFSFSSLYLPLSTSISLTYAQSTELTPPPALARGQITIQMLRRVTRLRSKTGRTET